MIVAITGGTGFVGRRLAARHLAQGDTVRVLTRRASADFALAPGALQVVHGDLLGDAGPLAEFAQGADILYHCAGELRRPERMAAVHVEGTKRLLAAAVGRIGRWVQLSSAGVYGQPGVGAVTESTICRPGNLYEQTKLASDLLVAEAAAGGAFEHAILRPTIVFGPTMPNRSLFAWISMIARGRFLFIGPPGASANYIVVDNVVDSLVRCGVDLRAAGQVFNISDHRTIEAFVGAIAELLGRRAPRLRAPKWPMRLAARVLRPWPSLPLTEARVAALTNRACYSCDAIRRRLDYEHRVSMEDGLRQVVARWREMQVSPRLADSELQTEIVSHETTV